MSNWNGVTLLAAENYSVCPLFSRFFSTTEEHMLSSGTLAADYAKQSNFSIFLKLLLTSNQTPGEAKQ